MSISSSGVFYNAVHRQAWITKFFDVDTMSWRVQIRGPTCSNAVRLAAT